MSRRALVLVAVAASAGVPAPDAHAEHVFPQPGDRTYAHRIVSGTGSVSATFTARPGWDGSVGQTGTTTITIARAGGTASLKLRRRGGYRFGGGDIWLDASGTRRTVVSRSDGNHCDETTVPERNAEPGEYKFHLASKDGRVFGSVPDNVEWLPGGLDVGAFFCEPPQDIQYLLGGALRPRFGGLRVSRFKQRSLSLRLHAVETYSSDKWVGELRWDIRLKLRRYFPKPRR